MQTAVPGGPRAIVRLRGAGRDTLYTYGPAADRIRLEAEGAPSFMLPAPFTPQTVWTALPDGVLAIWGPDRPGIGLLDFERREIGRIADVGGVWPVASADREHWLQNAIPDGFMGRRGIFEPLRRRAREVVRFPDRFPPVLELIGDPSGGVWIRKTTAGSGQVWILVGRGGEVQGTVRLPAGRVLLAVDRSGLAAHARDVLGVESVELYARPEWAR